MNDDEFIKMKPHYLIFLCLFSLSCTDFFQNLYGLNKPLCTISTINNFAYKNHIDTTKINLINPTKYVQYLKKYVGDTTQIKHLTQPLQIVIFEKRKLNSLFINCNVQGFPNLNWQITNKNKFEGNEKNIPQTLNIEDYAAACGLDSEVLLKKDTVVIVHWNYFMGRQTCLFLKEIKKNYATNNVFFVNNDFLFCR